MKSRLLFLAVVIVAIAGFYYATIRPALTPAQPSLNKRLSEEFRPLDIAPPPLPEPKFDTPTIPLPLPGLVRPTPPLADPVRSDPRASRPLEVPIQDGATIDFSIGAPVVRSYGNDKAELDKALREMAEATKDVKFPATEKK